MATAPKRIEVGFDGGQVIALRIPDEELDAMRKALGQGGWHRLATEGAEVDVDLGKVTFIRTEGDEHRVGFSSGGG